MTKSRNILRPRGIGCDLDGEEPIDESHYVPPDPVPKGVQDKKPTPGDGSIYVMFEIPGESAVRVLRTTTPSEAREECERLNREMREKDRGENRRMPFYWVQSPGRLPWQPEQIDTEVKRGRRVKSVQPRSRKTRAKAS